MKKLTLKSVLCLFYKRIKLKFFGIVDLWNIPIEDLKYGWQEKNQYFNKLVLTNNKFKIQYNNSENIIYIEMKLKCNYVKYFYADSCCINDELIDTYHGINVNVDANDEYFLKTGKTKQVFIYEFYWLGNELL